MTDATQNLWIGDALGSSRGYVQQWHGASVDLALCQRVCNLVGLHVHHDDSAALHVEIEGFAFQVGNMTYCDGHGKDSLPDSRRFWSQLDTT